jgi:hypothetical protein|tara:strand:- start:43 stop:381 length:339 start_codon:yes stop_codon:yes gene_type:complete
MKKLLIIGALVFSTIAFTQEKYDQKTVNNVNTYMTRISSTLTLSDEEKTEIFKIKAIHTMGYWEIAKNNERGTEEFNIEMKELNKAFNLNLREAFGKARAKEIAIASQAKKQ